MAPVPGPLKDLFDFIHLKGRVMERDGPSASFHSPNGHTAGAGPGAQNSVRVFHVSGRGPTLWAIIPCVPRCISRQLVGKWGIQDASSCLSHRTQRRPTKYLLNVNVGRSQGLRFCRQAWQGRGGFLRRVPRAQTSGQQTPAAVQPQSLQGAVQPQFRGPGSDGRTLGRRVPQSLPECGLSRGPLPGLELPALRPLCWSSLEPCALTERCVRHTQKAVAFQR